MAAKKGNLEKVKQLVNEGADINIKDNNEVSLLYVGRFCSQLDSKCVFLLL